MLEQFSSWGRGGATKIGEKQSRQPDSKYNFTGMQYLFFEKAGWFLRISAAPPAPSSPDSHAMSYRGGHKNTRMPELDICGQKAPKCLFRDVVYLCHCCCFNVGVKLHTCLVIST